MKHLSTFTSTIDMPPITTILPRLYQSLSIYVRSPATLMAMTLVPRVRIADAGHIPVRKRKSTSDINKGRDEREK